METENCDTNEPIINSKNMPPLWNVVSDDISHLSIWSASQKDIYDHNNSGI